MLLDKLEPGHNGPVRLIGRADLLLWVETLLPALLLSEVEEEPRTRSPASSRLLVIDGFRACNTHTSLDLK